jgi:hypothetical protein
VPTVAYGPRTVSAEQDSSAHTATTSITIVPVVSSISSGIVGPGDVITVNAAGFKATSAIKAYLDSTSSTRLVTNPASPATGSNGAISSLQITMPSDATAGSHTLLLADSGGHTSSNAIEVYKPTLTVTPSPSGSGAIVTVSGSGWNPYYGVGIDVGGAGMCSETPDSSGSFDSVCTVPAVPDGAQTLVGEQNNNAVTTSGTLTVDPYVTSIDDPAVSPGATVEISAQGLTAASTVTATLAGTSGDLTTNPADPTTSANGTVSSLLVTIPTTAGTGSKVLSIKDASGHAATTTLEVYKPVGTPAAKSGTYGQYMAFSGTKFQPNATVYMYLDGSNFCDGNAGTTGAFSTYCELPAVPGGDQTLQFEQDNPGVNAGIDVSSTFDELPTISYLPYPAVTAGATITLNANDLAATSTVTATLSGHTGDLVTNPSPATTNSSGTINSLLVTIPASAAAGNHTLTIATGSLKATATVTVYAPTMTMTDTSGAPGTTFVVNGSGFWPSNGIYLYFGTTYMCSLNADASGNINSYCTVPSLATGAYAVTAQQDNDNINISVGNFTITTS